MTFFTACGERWWFEHAVKPRNIRKSALEGRSMLNIPRLDIE
jgi:hypothetical protein